MSSEEQLTLILETISAAKAEGRDLTIAQAQRWLHRKYIQNQIYNKYGASIQGFLVIAGFTVGEEDGRLVHDQRFYNIFSRYLNSENYLSGADGVKLRDAMDRLGIDYLNSPTFPLEPIEEKKAV